MPEAGGSAGPEVIREGEMPLPATSRGVSPALPIGSTTEPTPLVEVWVSQSQSHEHRRSVHITQLLCGSMGGEEIPHPPPMNALGRWEGRL